MALNNESYGSVVPEAGKSREIPPIGNGFQPAPLDSNFIIRTSPVSEEPIEGDRITSAPERTNINLDPNTLDRLLGKQGDLAPKIKDPNRVGNVYAEEGVRSAPERRGFDNEPAMQINNIPAGFSDPAPTLTTPPPQNLLSKPPRAHATGHYHADRWSA